MKYYKIVNQKGHHGLKYHEGLNTDPLPFNPNGDCEDGGIYFAREDILAFIHYGTELYEVEPVGEVYENPCHPKKWKSHEVILKHIGKISNWVNLNFLVEQGADIHACYDDALRMAAANGHLNVVQYLVKLGADIHACYDDALRMAAANGYLNVVKYLVDNGADIHAYGDSALRNAAARGHLDVVKYLASNGADVHANRDEALCWAYEDGHIEVVEYLKSLK